MFEGKVKILMLKGEKGDSGDAGDYDELTNKPSINGVELDGNKTSADLGLLTQTQGDELEDSVRDLGNDVTEAINAFKADLDILGARTQVEYIPLSDIFQSQTNDTLRLDYRYNTVAGLAFRCGNTIMFCCWCFVVNIGTSHSAFMHFKDRYKPVRYPDSVTSDYFSFAPYHFNAMAGAGSGSMTYDTPILAYVPALENESSTNEQILKISGEYVAENNYYYISGMYLIEDNESAYEADPNSVIVQDGSVTTAKIADSAVTMAKLASAVKNEIPFSQWQTVSSGTFDCDNFDSRTYNFLVWASTVTVLHAPSAVGANPFTLQAFPSSDDGWIQILTVINGEMYIRHTEQDQRTGEWRRLGYPVPPASGTYTLKSVNGGLQWVSG